MYTLKHGKKILIYCVHKKRRKNNVFQEIRYQYGSVRLHAHILKMGNSTFKVTKITLDTSVFRL